MLVLITQTTAQQTGDLDILRAGLEAAGAAKLRIEHVGTSVDDIDSALALAGDERVVVNADTPGLNLVLRRALRAGRLETTEFAALPQEPIGYLRRMGLPAARSDQFAVAVSGLARTVGVIKDDSGGVCLDSAALRSWEPERDWWVRAVVDDQRLCDGTVRQLRLSRIGPDQLEARVQLGRFRWRTCRGRSLQLACDPALITADGVERKRPRSKRTFWSEPTLWRLALPS